MALIKCSKCGKEASDKAKTCSHCGFLINDDSWAFDIRSAAKSIITISILVAIIIFTYPLFFGGNKETKQTPYPESMVKQDTLTLKEESSQTPSLKSPIKQKSSVQLKSIFETIGYYKKHPTRVFSVYTNSKDFREIKLNAKKKMYTSSGMTMVFFFNDKTNTPDVTFVGAEFDKKYEKYCIAAYRKYPNGDEDFEYPFK